MESAALFSARHRATLRRDCTQPQVYHFVTYRCGSVHGAVHSVKKRQPFYWQKHALGKNGWARVAERLSFPGPPPPRSIWDIWFCFPPPPSGRPRAPFSIPFIFVPPFPAPDGGPTPPS